jgi:hypothetical protein
LTTLVVPPRTESEEELRKYRQEVCGIINGIYGNYAGPTSSVTGAYTVTDSDYFMACNGTFTCTLPTAVGKLGFCFIFKNIGTGAITLDGNGSETIDNLSSVILSQYDSIGVISDGTEWWII